jgi:hypothetical protein
LATWHEAETLAQKLLLQKKLLRTYGGRGGLRAYLHKMNQTVQAFQQPSFLVQLDV